MLALADVVGEKGYVPTSVADVIKRAGVSRQTFYEQFSEAKRAAVDTVAMDMAEAWARAVAVAKAAAMAALSAASIIDGSLG